MRTLAGSIALAWLVVAGTPGVTLAVGPEVVLDGSSHVVTFVTPGIYDFTVSESSSTGDLANTTEISHDVTGRIKGAIVDQSDGVTLTTELMGTCRIRNGRTVLKVKERGYGDLGDGQRITALGVRKSTVYGTGTGAVLHSVLRMKICVKQNKPFSTKTFTQCHSGGGGTGETLLGDVGDWAVRMDVLQQPVEGKLLGTGSITTYVHSSKYQRTTPMIIAGTARADGVARLKLSPLYAGGDGPVTITARVVAGAGVQYPAVTEILGVSGKLLGQRFNVSY